MSPSIAKPIVVCLGVAVACLSTLMLVTTLQGKDMSMMIVVSMLMMLGGLYLAIAPVPKPTATPFSRTRLSIVVVLCTIMVIAAAFQWLRHANVASMSPAPRSDLITQIRLFALAATTSFVFFSGIALQMAMLTAPRSRTQHQVSTPA